MPELSLAESSLLWFVVWSGLVWSERSGLVWSGLIWSDLIWSSGVSSLWTAHCTVSQFSLAWFCLLSFFTKDARTIIVDCKPQVTLNDASKLSAPHPDIYV